MNKYDKLCYLDYNEERFLICFKHHFGYDDCVLNNSYEEQDYIKECEDGKA